MFVSFSFAFSAPSLPLWRMLHGALMIVLVNMASTTAMAQSVPYSPTPYQAEPYQTTQYHPAQHNATHQASYQPPAQPSFSTGYDTQPAATQDIQFDATLEPPKDIPLSAVTERYCLEIYELEFAEQAPAPPHFAVRGRFQPCPGNSLDDDGSYIVFLDSRERLATTRLIKTEGQYNYLTRTYYRLHHLPALLETGQPLYIFWGQDNKRQFAKRMTMLHRPFCTLYYETAENLRIRCKRAG